MTIAARTSTVQPTATPDPDPRRGTSSMVNGRGVSGSDGGGDFGGGERSGGD